MKLMPRRRCVRWILISDHQIRHSALRTALQAALANRICIRPEISHYNKCRLHDFHLNGVRRCAATQFINGRCHELTGREKMRHFAVGGCEIERAQRFVLHPSAHISKEPAPRQFSCDGRIKFYIAFASSERDRETQFVNDARAKGGKLNGKAFSGCTFSPLNDSISRLRTRRSFILFKEYFQHFNASWKMRA